MIQKIYYLYRHIRLDKNEVFYVGIGTKNIGASPYKRAFRKFNRSIYWNNVVNKTKINIEIIFETPFLELIKQKEVEFIKLYGRKEEGGSLVNLTNGGDGIDGYNHTKETKEKISFHSKTRKRKSGYKLNLTLKGKESKINYMVNREVSIETKEKMSKNLEGNKRSLGHKVSDENKNKIKKRLEKRVYQFSIEGKLLNYFSSLSEAKEAGFEPRGIHRNINKITDNYKNYRWSFEENL